MPDRNATRDSSLRMRIASNRRKRAKCIGIGRVLGRLEADLHVALRRKVIDLVRLNFLDQANEVGGVREIAEMEKELDAFLMRIRIQMIDAAGIERRRASLHTMNGIAFGEQQLGEIRAVLTGGASNQSNLGRHMLSV